MGKISWEEALEYQDIVEDVAREWAYRVGDPSLREDLINHLYIKMVKTINPARATNNKKNYVRAALWKLSEKFMRPTANGPWRHKSLDTLIDRQGIQIDTDGKLYNPHSEDILSYLD